jgi:hypothetical protein
VKNRFQAFPFFKCNLYRYIAALSGAPECVAVLLDHGVAVDTVDPDGKTALWLAASNGDPDCVVGLYTLNPVVTHSLQGAWFQPLEPITFVCVCLCEITTKLAKVISWFSKFAFKRKL